MSNEATHHQHIAQQGRRQRMAALKQPRLFGRVGGSSSGLPEITAESKRHMSLVLDLDEDLAATLPEEEQWKALYWKVGYRILQ